LEDRHRGTRILLPRENCYERDKTQDILEKKNIFLVVCVAQNRPIGSFHSKYRGATVPKVQDIRVSHQNTTGGGQKPMKLKILTNTDN
jgi:hypothetical protein